MASSEEETLIDSDSSTEEDVPKVKDLKNPKNLKTPKGYILLPKKFNENFSTKFYSFLMVLNLISVSIILLSFRGYFVHWWFVNLFLMFSIRNLFCS